MTTRHREPVVCKCGHKGTLCWKENDQPFSRQYEEYRIDGFQGEGFYIDGYTTSAEALVRIGPKCPSCGQIGEVKLA